MKFNSGDIVKHQMSTLEILVDDQKPRDDNCFSGTVTKEGASKKLGQYSSSWTARVFDVIHKSLNTVEYVLEELDKLEEKLK